jgi:putative hydrolases of HD superfamily
MENIANLLFEARMLKEIPRSGFQFLGAGTESIAEHVYMVTFIAFVMAKLSPDVNLGKILSMCLLHDLPEARIGDLNAVQKKYVRAREEEAISDMAAPLPFGEEMTDLIATFNQGETKEARLARDADQIAFILELKALVDIGYKTPDKWIDHVAGRIKTQIGQELIHSILHGEWDNWWLKKFGTT